MRRLTSETNPESGTTTYVYDTDATCGSSAGDLVKATDNLGNTTCYAFDALHRMVSASYPSGAYASVTPSKFFVYDAATINGTAMSNAKGRVAEAYSCVSPCSSKVTDEGFSYSTRGEISDVYEATSHSGGYYHVSETYWPNGTVASLTNNSSSLPTFTYGVDAEGRVNTVLSSSGQNPVTATSYNNAGLPITVSFGSGDSDSFGYDPNTGRVVQYQFIVDCKAHTGAVTLNQNGTLSNLAITDPFNAPDNQTCSYGYDDLGRLVSANCGSAAAQTFSYDPFGNINKVGSPFSFQPTYSASSNRMTSLPGGFTPTYDANGNVTNDSNHTYSWDADGNSVMMDGIGISYDANDRAAENNNSGTFTEIVYTPSGNKLALMNGQTLVKAFIPLPGQAAAIYTSTGLDHYRHSDWLGSARLTSNASRLVTSTVAYAPFGETYAQSGSVDPSFTGENQDAVAGNYDLLYREYSNEGRFPSPDPVGLASVSAEDPRSWNRYAYVLNNPMQSMDPLGLACVGDEGEIWDDDISTPAGCQNAGGAWVVGPFQCYTVSGPGICIAPGPNGYYGNISGGGGGAALGLKGSDQTFKECMQQRSTDYTIGGAMDLTFYTNSMSVPGVDILLGNMITGALYGDANDSAKAAAAVSPDVLLKGMGDATTYGRRTTNILSLNLAGKGGRPAALKASTGPLKNLLEPVSKGLNLGLKFGTRVAIDVGLAGAEAFGCTLPMTPQGATEIPSWLYGW